MREFWGRTLKDTTPLQRGIIRHLILIIDLSSAMAEKDLRPTRYLLTIRYTQEFVTEFFEQNPISQLGIIGMRDGLALRVSDMGGNPSEHIAKLQSLREQEPKGHASLQNALDMGRAALLYVYLFSPTLRLRPSIPFPHDSVFSFECILQITTINACFSTSLTCICQPRPLPRHP